MRILYASERPPYPFFTGGAARAAHAILGHVVDTSGVECAAVGSLDYAPSSWHFPLKRDWAALHVSAQDEMGGWIECGYRVCLLRDFARSINTEMERFQPDVIWTQLEGSAVVLQSARQYGVRGLFFVHDAESDPNELRAIAALGAHMVCSSGFLARKVSSIVGRKVQVVYPPAELYFDTSGDPAGYLTMINPHRVKGLDTFLEIARQFPDQRFLLVESWKLGDDALARLMERLASLPNVRFQHRVADMRSIYRQTRLLLVPSIWEEGFGMVAIEAQSCGIPVIASARGGLPESVGDGGLLVPDYRNVDAWVAAIRRILDEPALYQRLADRALLHAGATEFTVAESARRFLAICSTEPPQPGLLARGWRDLRHHLNGLGGWRRPSRKARGS